MKNTNNPSVDKDVEQLKLSYIVDENAKLYNLFGKWAVSYEANNILTVWTQLLWSWVYTERKENVYLHKDLLNVQSNFIQNSSKPEITQLSLNPQLAE